MLLTIIRNTTAVAVSAAVLCVAGSVRAQDPFAESRTQTVTERPRPELDPLGIRAGGFTVFPSISATTAYDDNIFSTDDGEEDDIVWTVAPRVHMDSNWANHFVRVFGAAELVRYDDFGSEDQNNYNFGALGRLDIQRDSYLTAGASQRRLHEERSSPDDVNGIEPTQYDIRAIDLGGFNRWNRVSANVDFRAENRDFDDVASSTGAIINNDDRDRDTYLVTLRGGYEIQPEYEAFAEVEFTKVDYDDDVDDNGFNRDSDGYEARLGARVDLTGLIFGDVFVGYLSREYDDPALQDADGPTAGLDLTWNVTPLTTAKAGIQRYLSETTSANSGGIVATGVRASVDHELLRSLLLNANAFYTVNDYEGIDREDDLIGAGLGANYLVNRYLRFGVEYTYRSRDSNVAGNDYDNNIVMVRVRAQM